MAEILISLTIIGIIAAITLPALQANINEKTWETQKKALYSRMSQAVALMPSLNGYGVVFNSDGTINETETANKAAQIFITDGLSKVLKVTNICNYDALAKCGMPDKITTVSGNKIDTPVRLDYLNFGLVNENEGIQKLLNTRAAALETVNGEAVLTFYNPNCTGSDTVYEYYSSGFFTNTYVLKQQVCANFVYDLNGRKGPNKVGRDIGFITALYSSDSEVVMPVPMYYSGRTNNKIHNEAKAFCKALNPNYRLANTNEVLSVVFNSNIAAKSEDIEYWTIDSVNEQKAWMFSRWLVAKMPYSKSVKEPFICVKR